MRRLRPLSLGMLLLAGCGSPPASQGPTPGQRLMGQLEKLHTEARGARRAYEEEAEARAEAGQSEGHLAGEARFAELAFSIQCNFDADECVRGKEQYDKSLEPQRRAWRERAESARQRAAKAEARAQPAENEIDALRTRALVLRGEVQSCSERLAKVVGAYLALEKRLREGSAERPGVSVQRSEAEGRLAGATQHVDLWHGLFYAMDREEAGWSRDGGDSRAPDGGYVRVLQQEVVAPADGRAFRARKRLRKLRRSQQRADNRLEKLFERIAELAPRC